MPSPLRRQPPRTLENLQTHRNLLYSRYYQMGITKLNRNSVASLQTQNRPFKFRSTKGKRAPKRRKPRRNLPVPFFTLAKSHL